MDQHLVDDDLKEKRCKEREDLQRERGNQRLADELAVLDDRRNEPAEIEARNAAGGAGAGGNEKCAAAERELSNGNGDRTALRRVMQQRLAILQAGEHGKAAAFELDDAWEWHATARDIDRAEPRLQLEPLGG